MVAARLSRAALEETARSSLVSLARYRLRSVLSTLGVVLGVAAVVAMFSVSEGGRREALRQIEHLGLHNIIVRARFVSAAEAAVGYSAGLTWRDAQHLARLVPGLDHVAPVVERHVPVSSPDATRLATVLAVTPVYQDVLRVRAERGRLLSVRGDVHQRVCVLGAGIGRDLFGVADAVGQSLRIDGAWHTVVGVLSPVVGGSARAEGMPLRDINQALLVPLSAWAGGVGVQPDLRVDQVWLATADERAIERTRAVVDAALGRLHNGVPDVEVIVPRELLEHRLRTQRTFNIVSGSVALLSLLVGGIGITNIMLASVVERTPEIGLRRTVGATRAVVGLQFLFESLTLTILGGFIGLGLGALTSVMVSVVAGWPTYVSPMAAVLALLVAGVTGVVFGTYPAIQAARLQPIEAVRYE